jgi:hypothetical protein
MVNTYVVPKRRCSPTSEHGAQPSRLPHANNSYSSITRLIYFKNNIGSIQTRSSLNSKARFTPKQLAVSNRRCTIQCCLQKQHALQCGRLMPEREQKHFKITAQSWAIHVESNFSTVSTSDTYRISLWCLEGRGVEACNALLHRLVNHFAYSTSQQVGIPKTITILMRIWIGKVLM